MRTDLQIQASRANGRRSHGPVTADGKARSSQNAFRHGLLAKTILLAHEDKECFQQYIDQHIERFHPADDVEMNIVEEAVSAAWRERRCADLITMAMDTAIEDVETAVDGRRQLLSAFHNLASGPDMRLLQRYETRYHLMYHRCINTLIKLQKNRFAPEPEPSVPPPAVVQNEPEPVVQNEPEPAAALPARPLPPTAADHLPSRSQGPIPTLSIVPIEPETPLPGTYPHFDV